MNYMKKGLSLGLVGVLSISMLLTACGGSKETATQNVKEGSSEATNGKKLMNEPGEFPIVNEPVKLTALAYIQPSVTEDYENNKATKWIEEKTGIDLEFITAPRSEYRKKLNLLMSSGQYPDIILRSDFSLEEQQIYQQQGVLLRLNEMIDKYGVNTKKVFEDFPLVKDKFTLTDGSIVSLPRVDEAYHISMCQKLWVYQPWLDKLGLDMPQNTDEFYEMLKAFKEKDPNGNGLNDEVPLAGATNQKDTNIMGFLMNPFIYNAYDGKSPELRFVVNDGKIDVNYNKDEYKEGLKYIRKLYQEELIAPESFIQDTGQLTQISDNQDAPLLGSAPARFPMHFITVGGPSDRWQDYVTVPPLEGPNGNRVTRLTPYIGNAAFNITDKCEYPEVAFRLADMLYEEEAVLRTIQGEKDVDWAWADDGELGINGKQAIWKDLLPSSQKAKDSHWSQCSNSVRSREFRLGRVVTDPKGIESVLYNETKNSYEPYKVDEAKVLPPLIFTEDESAIVVDYGTAINQYVDEMAIKFITGRVDIEEGWSDYLKQLENLNFEEFLGVYQGAYDRKYK